MSLGMLSLPSLYTYKPIFEDFPDYCAKSVPVCRYIQHMHFGGHPHFFPIMDLEIIEAFLNMFPSSRIASD